MIDNFGSDYPDPSLISQIQTDANPDGDQLSNIFEMAFLTDPNVRDTPALELSSLQQEDPLGRIDLRIHRRRGSEQFVELFPTRNLSLEQAWENIPNSDLSVLLDAQGDDDERPETESIDFSIFEIYPSGIPEQSFYRIEARQTPIQP